jgi:hypothetical protein
MENMPVLNWYWKETISLSCAKAIYWRLFKP